jgi:hypothetical protein
VFVILRRQLVIGFLNVVTNEQICGFAAAFYHVLYLNPATYAVASTASLVRELNNVTVYAGTIMKMCVD